MGNISKTWICAVTSALGLSLVSYITFSYYWSQHAPMMPPWSRSKLRPHIPWADKTKGIKSKRLNVYDILTPNNDPFECVSFHVTKQLTTPICIHDTKRDIYVSASLKKHGTWESGHLNNIAQLFKKEPSLGLIDIGANIGTWTLAAAKMGQRVVAVEPSMANIRRLHKSAQLGNLATNITLLQNAISSDYGVMQLKEDQKNQGVKEVVSWKLNCSECSHTRVNAVPMDDLLQVLPFKRAILKIDVEGHEMQAFRRADLLMQDIFIPYIIMEWQWFTLYWATASQNRMSKVADFINFFRTRNYYPYDSMKRKLNPKEWASWPNDVYFRYEL